MREFSFFFCIVFLSMTCQKKTGNLIQKGDSNEEITYNKIDRNDIPPPPDSSWWTIDTSNLDICEQRLWDYLKTFYPINDENYWDYNLYSILGEPADIWENRAFISKYGHFFRDTIYSENGLLFQESQPCSNVDTTFFHQSLGQPTCKSNNLNKKQITYFYHLKLRYRSGPCAYIFDEGDQYEQSCWPLHFQYCGLIKARFHEDTGALFYIDFFGSSG